MAMNTFSDYMTNSLFEGRHLEPEKRIDAKKSCKPSSGSVGGLLTVVKVIVCLTIAAALIGSSEALPVTCKVRDSAHLVERLQNHAMGNGDTMHHSFFSTPTGISIIQANLSASGSLVDGSVSGDRGNVGTCGPLSTSGHVHEASLCGWHYRLNHDTERYPTTVTEAFRDLDHCEACHLSASEALRTNTARCHAVKYNIPVMRRTSACDSEGFYIYQESWQEVRVGYTCAATLSA